MEYGEEPDEMMLRSAGTQLTLALVTQSEALMLGWLQMAPTKMTAKEKQAKFSKQLDKLGESCSALHPAILKGANAVVAES